MFSPLSGSCSTLSPPLSSCSQQPLRKLGTSVAHLLLHPHPTLPKSILPRRLWLTFQTTTTPLTRSFDSGKARVRATLDEKEDPAQLQEEPEPGEQILPTQEVVESVKVLKNAAKTRKVKAEEVLTALSVIEKSKLDSSRFLETLGGSQSPGRTWMLIFTAEKKLDRGRYFPITAVQRFDAAGKRIENGVFLGPLGYLTFEGRFSWKKRILAFVFELIRIKVGPLNPLEIGLGQQRDREPNTKDPFFIWFYIDEEIAVARGRSGGTAFWCRCRRVSAS